jgi:hypothetical protein
MPFNLTDNEIQNAFDAIEHHGYCGLIPKPLEWTEVKTHWAAIKAYIAACDLDSYKPATPMVIFAPKSRATVRPVCLMHPVTY